MRSKIGSGIVAGLLAGAVFAILMHAISAPGAMGGRMPMIHMMAAVVHSDRLLAGWAYVLASGAVMGVVFALLLGSRATTPARGLVLLEAIPWPRLTLAAQRRALSCT